MVALKCNLLLGVLLRHIFFLRNVLCFCHVLAFYSTTSKAFQSLSTSSVLYPKTVAGGNYVRVRYNRVVPLPFEEELGISNSIVFQNKFFDPLHLATEERFVQYRESELKHGRVAMLATIGLIVPDVLFAHSQEALISLNQLLGVLSDQPKLTAWPRNSIQTLQSIPRELWVSILCAVAILELFILKPRSSRALPGDYATGFFGIHNYGKHEKLLQQELEYGRIAMIGVVVQIVWEILTNTSVVEPYRVLMNYAVKVFH